MHKYNSQTTVAHIWTCT